MKKMLKWGVIILILSGWVAFGMLYAKTAREKAEAGTRITELQSQLDSYQFMFKDVAASQQKIDDVISTLQALKGNLERIKDRIDKDKGAEKNESSENR